MDNTNTIITVYSELQSGSINLNIDCVVYPTMAAFRACLDNPLATTAYEYHEFVNYKSKYVTFSRYVENIAPAPQRNCGMIPTRLYLNSVDSARTPISMEIRPPVLGKSTDRSQCTIVASVKIIPFVDMWLCERFNTFINNMREKYHSVFLINFRGVGVVAPCQDLEAANISPRKRIPYNAVYAILGRFCDEIILKGVTGNIPKLIQERNNRDPQFERLMRNVNEKNTSN
jgi:hypothetical protein